MYRRKNAVCFRHPAGALRCVPCGIMGSCCVQSMCAYSEEETMGLLGSIWCICQMPNYHMPHSDTALHHHSEAERLSTQTLQNVAHCQANLWDSRAPSSRILQAEPGPHQWHSQELCEGRFLCWTNSGWNFEEEVDSHELRACKAVWGLCFRESGVPGAAVSWPSQSRGGMSICMVSGQKVALQMAAEVPGREQLPKDVERKGQEVSLLLFFFSHEWGINIDKWIKKISEWISLVALLTQSKEECFPTFLTNL